MSLNIKKYWLDGIFDDEEYAVPKEDLKPSENKSHSLTSYVMENSVSQPIVEEEKEIIAKWYWKEEILCRNYVYCDNVRCNKRHYYKRTYVGRMEKKRYINSSFCITEDKSILDKTLMRFKREGAKIIFR